MCYLTGIPLCVVIYLGSDEDSSVEDGNGTQEIEETCNENHLAIVELNQKFKVLGNFTLFTTKVNTTLYELCKI